MLHSGYSYDTVRANIAEMQRAGHAIDQAIAAAYNAARRAFFKRYPGGLLPGWLAYPKGLRSREHYGKDGSPRHPLANPSRKLAKAARLYEDFTGHTGQVRRIKIKPLPKVGLAFGHMTAVEYISARDGKLYRHSFRPLRSRPLLIATHDGKQVLMHGGAINFTERGIENVS